MRHMANSTQWSLSNKQQGMALIVSLVLMATMTILGVSTLAGTRLSEKIASNSQQKSTAFEAAESAIQSVSNFSDLNDAITPDTVTLYNNPSAVTLTDASSNFASGFDLLVDSRGIDISGTLQVQYCGETRPIGTSLSSTLDGSQMVDVLVDIKSVANVANSGANADHLARVRYPIPQTGRTGNCAAP